MPIAISDVPDLVLAALRALDKKKWSQVATTLQRYVFMGRFLDENKVEVGSGRSLQFNVMTSQVDSTRAVGLFDKDVVNIGNVMTEGEVPWASYNTNFALDLKEESVTEGEAQLLDIVKIRRATAMISLAEYWENEFWTRLPVASEKPVRILGLQNWVTFGSAGNPGRGDLVTAGFTAPEPAFGAKGGISSTTYSTWKNYQDQYETVTSDDLLRKVKKALELTNFQAPIGGESSYEPGMNGDAYRMFTTIETKLSLERLQELRNDNLGPDLGLGKFRGQLTINGNLVQWVPIFDDATRGLSYAPFYGLNFNTFKVKFKSGQNMRQTGPERMTGTQHDTLVTHFDNMLNVVCNAERDQFVIARKTA